MNNYNQTKKLLHDIKETGDIKLFIASDHEGGRVQKLSRVGLTPIPPMGEVGKTMSEEDIFNLAKQVGAELKGIGVDMDMAPVLDVFSNPDNKVIGDRAFASDPVTVSKLAMAFAKGLKDEKIVSVSKHFPGHGNTSTDSHIDLPVVEKDLEALKCLELVPFVEAIRQNIPGIMIGHLAVPKITDDNLPASLSRIMISDLLKEDYKYKGLVMPDSLKMKALSNYFTESEIYLRCVNAGNDMLLMPQNINKAFETVYNAVNEGYITEDRIDDAVYRILSIKFDYGFFDKEYHEYISKNIKSL